MRLIEIKDDETKPDRPGMEPATEGEWIVAILAFAFWFDFHKPPEGRRRGSCRSIVAAGITSRPGYDVYTDLLCRAGVMWKRHRYTPRWVGGYNHRTLRQAIKTGRLTLALPRGWPPPVAEVPITQSQTAQGAQSAQ